MERHTAATILRALADGRDPYTGSRLADGAHHHPDTVRALYCAIAALEASDTLPAVALVDWNMPNMNGLELIRAVRADAATRDLPIVMVTTESETSQMVRALAAGASEYVMKPFTAEVVLDKLAFLGILAPTAVTP